MKKVMRAAGIGSSLVAGLLLTGCIDHSYKMIGKECPQVIKYEPPYATLKNYLHSITLYEGYETRAHFDVLCMSEKMRAIYAALQSAKRGHDEHEHAAFLAQQLEENESRITLYVLAQISDSSHVSLSDKQSAWSLHLETESGKKLIPLSIKEVELEPEIRSLFGHRYLQFKKSYRVQFAATDISGKRNLHVGELCTLHFAGSGMSGCVEWIPNPIESGESDELLIRHGDRTVAEEIARVTQPKVRDEDFYW